MLVTRRGLTFWLRARWLCTTPSCLPSVVLALALTLSPAVAMIAGQSDGERERPPPSAVQTPYRSGVPHTDAHGAPRTVYSAGQSFFPIGLYHGLTGRHFGRDYDLAALRKAGFNTIHVWEGLPSGEAAAAAAAAGLALVFHNPSDADVRSLSGRPELLAWYLDEEPSLHLSPDAQAAALTAFAARADSIRRLDPAHPILVIDYPAFLGARRADWIAWASAGDISSHDNYPLRTGPAETLDTALGVPRSVALAVRATRERKPLWLVVQAMASPVHGWRMPEPDELRAMVYTGLIHGATGIIYFALDSFVTRDGQILGIAPDAPSSYGPTPGFGNRLRTPALTVGEAALGASRRLWSAVVGLNRELSALAPALLSPTAGTACGVAVSPSLAGLSLALLPGSGAAVSSLPVRTLLKDGPDGLILLAVNLDRQPLGVEFRCDHRMRAIHRLFENTGAPVVSDTGSWHDAFAPLGVHVYRLTPAPAPPP